MSFQTRKENKCGIASLLNELEMVEPINPRDAFYGGRTGAVSLHCKAALPDLIKYADVTSLYPFVNKYKEYPVSFPIIYTSPSDQDIAHYFGIAKIERCVHTLCLLK